VGQGTADYAQAVPPPAFLHGFAKPTNERFITIVRADGAAVFDADGRRYVDGLASLWYCQVGHGRREIIDAITAQLGVLDAFQTFELFTNEPADALCERLVALAPLPNARVFLTSSGSEAVDSALKLIRAASICRGEPDRQVVIARNHAYHGVTYGGMTLQGLVPNRTGFGPLVPDVVHVDHDHVDAVAKAIAEVGTNRVAAVIAEPVLGAGGVRPPTEHYLHDLRELCDRTGALLVLDEVICGFGRLGGWWGANRYDVVPDLITFAKGVTSGYQPLGGVLVGEKVLDALSSDPAFVLRHGHTYSGHPAACAAALANLDLLASDSLLPTGAARIASSLGVGLQGLADAGLLAEARGEGGMWGAGLHPHHSAPAVRDALLERGVIARPIFEHTIAFCPPLITAETDLQHCVDALADSLRSLPA